MRSAFVPLNHGITYILEFDYRGYGIFSHNFVEVQVYGIWSFQSGTVYPGKVLVEPHTQRARMEITVPINAPVAIRFVAHGADADHAISVSNVQLVGIPTPIISHNPFRYAGMYWDGHRGEYYTPNRNFNPRLGRWNRPDPFFHAMNGTLQSCVLQAGNLFAYTMNNPVMWVDPTGLASSRTEVMLRFIIEKHGGNVHFTTDAHGGSAVTANLFGITETYAVGSDIRIVEGRSLIYNGRLMSDFGLNYTQSTHQPWDEFPSEDYAAIAFSLMWTQHGTNIGLEMGAMIYRNRNGTYSFGREWTGMYNNVIAGMVQRIAFPERSRLTTTLVGLAHTHPSGNNWFSIQDRDLAHGLYNGRLVKTKFLQIEE